MATSTQSFPTAPAGQGLALHWRVLISIALVLHLIAVISFPWSAPDPAGPLVAAIARPFGPYLDALYLAHGYRFFAPAPGPSHLVQHTLEMPDGTTRVARFPDLQTEWPRLFYHRHFMLSEKFDSLLRPPQLPVDAPQDVRDEWSMLRHAFQAVARSYAMHLLETTGAERVTLELIEHDLPTPAEWEKGNFRLTDPKTYRVVWTGSYRKDTPEDVSAVGDRRGAQR